MATEVRLVEIGESYYLRLPKSFVVDTGAVDGQVFAMRYTPPGTFTYSMTERVLDKRAKAAVERMMDKVDDEKNLTRLEEQAGVPKGTFVEAARKRKEGGE